jgi:hypothetical protein
MELLCEAGTDMIAYPLRKEETYGGQDYKNRGYICICLCNAGFMKCICIYIHIYIYYNRDVHLEGKFGTRFLGENYLENLP